MSVITSKISPVVLGSGRSKSTIYTSTRTTKLGDGTFHVDILQYSDAKGAGGKVIGVRDSDNPNNVTWNSNASGQVKSNEGRIKEASKTQMQSMRKDFVTNAQEAERYNAAQGNRNTAIGDEGIWPEYLKSGPSPTNSFGSALDAVGMGNKGSAGAGLARKRYDRNLVYPTTLKRTQQDTLRISVLKYKPKKMEGLKFANRSAWQGRVIGAVTLPVPGGVNDANKTEWGSGSMSPKDIATSGAVKAFLGKEGAQGALDDAQKSINQLQSNSGDVSKALANFFTEELTGATDLLARTEGAIMNPNMELLFRNPSLRPFSFTYRFSPRDRGEAVMVRRIIRMFKQSMAPQTTTSELFLKAANTYKLEFLSGGRSGQTHKYLPKIKECALNSCNVNYTPDGSYMTYEDSSMVSYEMSLSFTEIEPIYNNDMDNSDNDIGF